MIGVEFEMDSFFFSWIPNSYGDIWWFGWIDLRLSAEVFKKRTTLFKNINCCCKFSRSQNRNILSIDSKNQNPWILIVMLLLLSMTSNCPKIGIHVKNGCRFRRILGSREIVYKSRNKWRWWGKKIVKHSRMLLSILFREKCF